MKYSSIKNLHAWYVLIIDLFAVQLAWLLAETHFFDRYSVLEHDLPKSIFLLIASLVSFKIFKTYAGLWRYTSTEDLFVVIKSVLLILTLFVLARFFYDRLIDISRTSIALFIMLAVGLMAAVRITSRVYHFGGYRFKSKTSKKNNYILIGAGSGGEKFLREYSQLPNRDINIIGILDDDVNLKGKSIKGIPIIGSIEVLSAEELMRKYEVRGAIIAIPSLKRQGFQKIYNLALQMGLDVKVLPSMTQILSGDLSVTNLQNVTIEDLLGRDPVDLDVYKIQKDLYAKTILVTGGGGSIGSEIVRQILKLSSPKKIVILDHSEINLYQIERELSQQHSSLIKFCLGSILDKSFLDRIANQDKPNIIFHAAAYKHVPLLESQPKQAFINNIIGTRNICELSIKYKVEKFIMVSTDKAVNPSNVMGRTKRVAELVCQAYGARNSNVQFITTRFGNVLGSAGSVIPLFKKQLKQGGPITVTHKDIERYFMTIPEASQLVIYSGAVGQNRDVFVLDMGQPVKISYLAEQLIRLSGKEPYIDIDIVYSGLRPGEKMYEELFYQQENLVGTSNKKLLKSSYKLEVNLNEILYDINKFYSNMESIPEAKLSMWLEDVAQ